LLEVAWEAFENAGQGRDDLFGRDVGVFIGIGNADYARLMHDSVRADSIDLYATTGNVFSTAAGRLSYTLGLQGPSVALDTACSSSLVAVHLACQSLRADESVLALAGGVNLILAPDTMVAMSRVPGGLAPDGRCKAFDAAANGLGRGEGCGLVVLKRLSDAVRDRDSVFALIRGSAVNQDGRSAGLTVPSAQAQAALIRKALSSSKVRPDEVEYLETHGPGTALGDPIEAGALGMVFGDTPSRARPLVVGSVKTNIGHLESAAGAAGLIKTALILRHGEIPPNLHFKTPNPNIPWDSLPITVPTERSPLGPGPRSRIAAVSAFGVSGTNAHAVLEEPPPEPVRSEPESRHWETPAQVLTLSARSAPALHQLLERYQEHLDRHPTLDLNDVCYTAGVGRFHFAHRFVALAKSRDHLREQLQAARAGNASPGVFRRTVSGPPNVGVFIADIDFVDASVRDELRARFSVFRSALDECDRWLQTRTAATTEPGQDRCPIALSFAYALAMLLRSWGVLPSVVMGHGVGEIVASVVAGALSVDHGLALSLAWGDLMGSGRRSKRGESHLDEVVSRLEFSEPATPVLSQVTNQRISDELASARYWSRCLETTPRPFDESLRREQVDLLLELGGRASSGDAAYPLATAENTQPIRRQRMADLPTAI
jgi:myxalamid-type polyketide synthase MxaB